jgi:hypothetical protein
LRRDVQSCKVWTKDDVKNYLLSFSDSIYEQTAYIDSEKTKELIVPLAVIQETIFDPRTSPEITDKLISLWIVYKNVGYTSMAAVNLQLSKIKLTF